MNLQAEAPVAPAAAHDTPRTSIHWNRWSVFVALLGVAVLIPSYFVPAMLVANALEGPRLFSVWTSIVELWRSDHGFLSALIFVFSLVFPLLKLSLSLLCASGTSWLRRRTRIFIVYLASWTAKYSMLDVLVIAMIVLLVKVGDYVRVMPCKGIYLFTFAIFCSAVAGVMLEFGLKTETSDPPTHRRHWKRHLLLVIAGSALAGWGWKVAERESGGDVRSITMSRLTKRGELKRSIEKTFALQEITKEGHELFSQDTWKRVREWSQALSTDAGWQKPEAFLILHRHDGTSMETARVPDVNFDDDNLVLTFKMPTPVLWNDVDSMKLVSNVVYTKFLNASVEEENVHADAETYSMWTRQWHGRIYTFEINGPRGAGFIPALAMTGAGLVAACFGLSGLLSGTRK